MDRRRLATIAFAVLATFAAPLGAGSATAGTPAPTPPPDRRVTYTYKTFLDPEADYWTIKKFDVDFGMLVLTFEPGGAIQGTYRPDFGRAMDVSGRIRAGGRVSLEIGSHHYSGRFTSRGIVATTGPMPPSWRLWAQFVAARSAGQDAVTQAK